MGLGKNKLKVIAIVTLTDIVILKQIKKDTEVLNYERKDELHTDLIGILHEHFGNKSVDLSLVLLPPSIEVDASHSIVNDWKNKYFPKRIEEESRILAGKYKESHYVQCVTMEVGPLIYLNIYSANVAQVNILMEEFEKTKIKITNISPFFYYIGETVCKDREGTLITYRTKGKNGKSVIYLMLYSGSFLVAYRELYEVGTKLQEEIIRTVTYVQNNLSHYKINELLTIDNSLDYEILSDLFIDVPITNISTTDILMLQDEKKGKKKKTKVNKSKGVKRE